MREARPATSGVPDPQGGAREGVRQAGVHQEGPGNLFLQDRYLNVVMVHNLAEKERVSGVFDYLVTKGLIFTRNE